MSSNPEPPIPPAPGAEPDDRRWPALREAWTATSTVERVAALVLALALLVAWSAIPAPSSPPSRPVVVTNVALAVQLDRDRLENVHTLDFDVPAGAVLVAAALDGHPSGPLHVVGPAAAHVVFQFAGSHAHQSAKIALETREGTKEIWVR